MKDIILRNLEKRFAAYTDLIDEMDDAFLSKTVNVPKHKTLADHLWCVVGGRQSYTRALAAGEWQGFECSLKTFGAEDFAEAFSRSAKNFAETTAAVADWSVPRLELLAELSEHEVMHEGQIIRHMFALERALPTSWRWA